MERDELVRRLDGHEWTDVEFKRAQRGVPVSAYETVSAFSNTEGGWLVFGVRERAGGFETVGVLEADKIQNDFLSTLRSGQKLNRTVAAKERLIENDGKALLVFHIPEARRQDKPIYLGGDLRKSFVRRGAGDERCTQTEIERMLRDAADERYDAQTVDLNLQHCFDDESLRRYRRLFDERNPDHDDSLSHLEFLRRWGLVVEAGERLLPTRASILLFGAAPAFCQVLPRPVADLQWRRGDWSDGMPEERWADRLLIETNLVKAWKQLLDRYLQRAEKPFAIDPETLQRKDRPPDYLAFREAAINLLIHQDYADTRTPTIRFFDDRTLLWNPGNAFASAEELMEPGDREVRNPRIVATFRRIGLSEQAGTGIHAIVDTCRRLGRVPPIIENDRARQAFRLTLAREELLSEEQMMFQAGLGLRLDDAEARAFAIVRREGAANRSQLRAVTGLSGPDAAAVAERLETQKLIEPVGAGGRYALAEHLKERLGGTDPGADRIAHPRGTPVTDRPDTSAPDLVTDHVARPWGNLVTTQVDAPDPNLVTDQLGTPAPNLVTDQVGRPSGNLVSDQVDIVSDQVAPPIELSETHRKIVALCDAPRRLTEIMAALGVTGRNHFRKRHLNPLIRAGVVAMTNPAKPRASNQRYVVTDAGARLAARRATGR